MKGEGKRFLHKLGDSGYRKLVMDMIRQNKTPDPNAEASLYTAQTLQDVVSITLAARKAFGKARFKTAAAAAEFLRVMVGDETAAGEEYSRRTV